MGVLSPPRGKAANFGTGGDRVPTAPPRTCSRCHQPAPRGRACPCRPAFEGAAARAGGRRWRQIRDTQLREHPYCQHPDCRRLAAEVDHVVPLAEGGTDAWANLASLCPRHHREKTARDSRRGKTRAR
ncbi:HNH endonuclease [Mycolicibacterium palauense]|uniref:HNH endonuclease n=1 Tax=Mycolicibacterium palauense TaxID=2034511 RepID=UPI002E242A34